MNSEGIGLGLYITKMITQQFGGDVSVDSFYGRGSTFKLYFKLSNEENQEDHVQRLFNNKYAKRPALKLD